MVDAEFYEKLIEISNFMEEKGDGISYIRNEADYYTIGTRKYSEEIARYLDETVETWEGSEDYVNEKKKKGKRSEAAKRIGYIWKIPLSVAK
ncbi:hypothetical protein [Methanobacterium sp.]|uniref:hypothetical protein n=1 Tax=Methanobacterium sp. TaxID=2164 RepID=UPI003C732220